MTDCYEVTSIAQILQEDGKSSFMTMDVSLFGRCWIRSFDPPWAWGFVPGKGNFLHLGIFTPEEKEEGGGGGGGGCLGVRSSKTVSHNAKGVIMSSACKLYGC